MWRDWAANPMFFPPYELDAAAAAHSHSHSHSSPPPPPPPPPPHHGCRDFNFNPSLFMARRKLKRYRAKRVHMQLHPPGATTAAGGAGSASQPPSARPALPPPLRT